MTVCIVYSERVRVPARGHCKRKEIRGFFKFAEVVPWCNWESQEGLSLLLNVHVHVHVRTLYTMIYMCRC